MNNYNYVIRYTYDPLILETYYDINVLCLIQDDLLSLNLFNNEDINLAILNINKFLKDDNIKISSYKSINNIVYKVKYKVGTREVEKRNYYFFKKIILKPKYKTIEYRDFNIVNM